MSEVEWPRRAVSFFSSSTNQSLRNIARGSRRRASLLSSYLLGPVYGWEKSRPAEPNKKERARTRQKSSKAFFETIERTTCIYPSQTHARTHTRVLNKCRASETRVTICRPRFFGPKKGKCARGGFLFYDAPRDEFKTARARARQLRVARACVPHTQTPAGGLWKWKSLEVYYVHLSGIGAGPKKRGIVYWPLKETINPSRRKPLTAASTPLSALFFFPLSTGLLYSWKTSCRMNERRSFSFLECAQKIDCFFFFFSFDKNLRNFVWNSP